MTTTGVVPIGTRRLRAECSPGRVDDLDVLVVLYGRSLCRAAAVAITFARWDALYRPMPRVLCAWCYDGDAPGDLASIPDYPWLHRIMLPQYDIDDGVFRKEGLLNYLLRCHSTAPYILTLDADVWASDPHWFSRIRASLSGGDDIVCQPFRVVTDTREPRTHLSWSSRFLPGAEARAAVQPGLGWGFSRAWVYRHRGADVFNPWLVTGSGDSMFVLEHCQTRDADELRSRHFRYRYAREAYRPGLPPMVGRCVDRPVWHENHTDLAAVPEDRRTGTFADRAYVGSRQWLDWAGPLSDHVYLDTNGVPMPMDQHGPFVAMCRRKPELQRDSDVRRVFAEVFGREAGKGTP